MYFEIFLLLTFPNSKRVQAKERVYNLDVIYGYSFSKKSGLLMACCPKAHLTMLLGKIYLSCNEACLQSHTYGVSGFFFRNFYTFLQNRKEVKIVLTSHLIEFFQTLFHKFYWSSQLLKDWNAELQNFSNLKNWHSNLDLIYMHHS